MEIPILYEDPRLIVVNKPPGIIVNNADSVKAETVQDWAAQKLSIHDTIPVSEDDTIFIERAGIVHRIDKETSGCLVIAKTPSVFVEMQRQFKERLVKKTYLAIVHGAISPERGEIHAPVGRLPWNRERFGILPDGKDAITRYAVQKTFASPGAKETLSYVELYPETGRTHQIRVHLKYINHPIVGDFQYAGRKTSRDDRVWAGRVLLHAWKIVLINPDGTGELAIEAPVPDDMRRIIS